MALVIAMANKAKASKDIYLLNIIAFIVMSVLTLTLSACKFTAFRHKPYLLVQRDVIFEDNSGNLYIEGGYDYGTRSLCTYSYEKTNNVSKVQFKDGNEYLNYECGSSNSKYFFSALNPSSSDIGRIESFNKSFEMVSSTNIGKDVRIVDIECTEQYVYTTVRDNETKIYSLIRFDCLLKEMTILIDNLNDINNYEDSDVRLFFKKSAGSDYYMSKYENTRLLFLGNHRYSPTVDLYLSDDSIVIINNGEQHLFEKEYDFNELYNYAYLIDGKIVFATYKNVLNNECGSLNNLNGECICGINESYVFSFDTITNEVQLINRFEKGAFLINYDLQETRYYYDGGLYINDRLIRECEKVESDELEEVGILEKSEERLKYYLSYYNGNFYGI